MLRLVINLWLLLGFLGSAVLAIMVFSYMIVLFDEMIRKLRK